MTPIVSQKSGRIALDFPGNRVTIDESKGRNTNRKNKMATQTSHSTDRVCHLCGKQDSIFGFQNYYILELKQSLYVCHMCQITMVKDAIYAKGIENVNPLSTVSGNK